MSLLSSSVRSEKAFLYVSQLVHSFNVTSILLILTAQNFDAESMQVVFGPQDRTHPDDEEVPETGDESHDPDRYTQDNVSQQIFKR